MMVALLALASGGMALAQARVDPMAPLPAPKASAQPAAAQPTPGAVTPPVAVVPPAPPVVLPPPLWPVADAIELSQVIAGVASEGLSPKDYAPGELVAAIQSGDPARLSLAATASFNKLSSDLSLGHVRGEDRIDWHVVDHDLDADHQRQLLDAALAGHRVGDALRGLLPTHPQYGALKLALAEPRNAAMVNVIRLNLDRWRWLPRDFGGRYLIVNVPA